MKNETEVAATGRVRTRQAATRVRLLRAAHRLMSQQGVDATAIREITDLADVGFGTFYSYFTSKDDVAAQVLDCVIHNLGTRNDLANRGVTDPVRVMSNSVRLVAREMLTDPMWAWWVKRTDLLVSRMRAGFAYFGLRDLELATAAGAYRLSAPPSVAWNQLIWLLAGGIKDILEGEHALAAADPIAESVLRVMGVELATAHRLAHMALPLYPRVPVDYQFGQDGLTQKAWRAVGGFEPLIAP